MLLGVKGGKTEDGLFHPYLGLTPQYQQSLSTTQESILTDFFTLQLAPRFQAFIEAAPSNPNMGPLRIFIIANAFTMASSNYSAFLNKYYPEVKDHDLTYEQNMSFRELFISFNRLCIGELDINHWLYAAVFDCRLSPSKLNSPTKRNLVNCIFKMQFKKTFDISLVDSDPLVESARDWIMSSKVSPPIDQVNVTSSDPNIEVDTISSDLGKSQASSSVKKRLSFC
jgi:hypothetical protein